MNFIIEYWLEALFAALIGIFGFLCGKLAKRAQKERAEQEAIKRGIQALLRDRIIQAYWHYKEKECCPIYALENIEDMYIEYTNLGGNGTVTKLVKELKELPTK